MNNQDKTEPEKVFIKSSKTGLPVEAKPCQNGCGRHTEYGGWCNDCLRRDLEINSPHLLEGGAGFGAW